MTHTRLIEELAAEVRDALKGLKLPIEYQREREDLITDTDDFVTVNVFENYLPENIFETTSYLPFVLVEWLETHDDLKAGSTADIGLSIATFSFEQYAWKNAFHIMSILRERLLEKRLIAKRFRLKDAKWQTPESQPREFFYITGILSYDIYQPIENFPAIC